MAESYYTAYGEEVSREKIADLLSTFPQFHNWELGEDNEGQAIIYTGLYRKPDPVAIAAKIGEAQDAKFLRKFGPETGN